MIRRLWTFSSVRYLLVGIVGYLFEMGILYGGMQAKLAPVIAVSISFAGGLVLSFILQKVVAFQNQTAQKETVLRQVLLTGCLVIFNYLLSVISVHLLQTLVSPMIIRTGVIIITTITNYFTYKLIIFRK